MTGIAKNWKFNHLRRNYYEFWEAKSALDHSQCLHSFNSNHSRTIFPLIASYFLAHFYDMNLGLVYTQNFELEPKEMECFDGSLLWIHNYLPIKILHSIELQPKVFGCKQAFLVQTLKKWEKNTHSKEKMKIYPVLVGNTTSC